MTDLAKLVVKLEAESARLHKDLDKANRELKRFGQTADKATSIAKKGFVALGAAISVGALVAATKNSLNYADAIGKAAEKTGFTTKSLQELRYAASQTGVSVTELEGGLGRFTKRLGLARAGTGAAANAYKKLGIDLSQSNEQVFRQVVDTLGNMEDQTNRLALTTRLFGDDAQKLALTFKNGTAGLDQFADKAARLGLVLDRDLIRGAEKANDELDTMRQVLSVQLTKVFLELAPTITQIGQAFADAAPHVASFAEGIRYLGEEVAATINGAAADDIVRLQDQAQKIRDVLKGGVGSFGERIRFFGKDGLVEYYDDGELRAELAKIEAAISDYYSRQRSVVKAPAAKQKPNPVGTDSFFGSSTENEGDKIREAYDKAQESLSQTLALIGTTTEYQKVLWEVENGRYKDLTKNQKQALLNTAQRIDQKRSDIEVTENAARVEAEAAKEAERLNAQLDTQADRWRELVNPTNGVYSNMAELDLLLEKGKISWETYGEAMFRVMDDMEDDAEEVENKWEELGLTFSSAFEDAIVSGENLSDILKGLEQDLLRIFTRKLVTEPLGNFASDLAGDILSFDGGGYTGSGARVGGLDGKGGYLAMLHPQETVIDHTKRQRSGMQVINNISISAPDGRISNESMSQLQARLGRSMQRSLARNS